MFFNYTNIYQNDGLTGSPSPFILQSTQRGLVTAKPPPVTKYAGALLGSLR
jgi:hypothetical protein